MPISRRTVVIVTRADLTLSRGRASPSNLLSDAELIWTHQRVAFFLIETPYSQGDTLLKTSVEIPYNLERVYPLRTTYASGHALLTSASAHRFFQGTTRSTLESWSRRTWPEMCKKPWTMRERYEKTVKGGQRRLSVMGMSKLRR